MKNTSKNWYLGKTKGANPQSIWLSDFFWACGWYWSGGGVGNHNSHSHLDNNFLAVAHKDGHHFGGYAAKPYNGCYVWEPLSFFLDDAQYTENQWWRIKDLFRQFYAYKAAAEAFQYGGHCISTGRTEAEIVPEMAKSLNLHIEKVIIPAIRCALNKEV